MWEGSVGQVKRGGDGGLSEVVIGDGAKRVAQQSCCMVTFPVVLC